MASGGSPMSPATEMAIASAIAPSITPERELGLHEAPSLSHRLGGSGEYVSREVRVTTVPATLRRGCLSGYVHAAQVAFPGAAEKAEDRIFRRIVQFPEQSRLGSA
jgi:hypothetical protein